VSNLSKINQIMNKAELINAIAEGAGLSKVDAKKALDATVKAVSGALVAGDKVSLIGFGTFSVAERSARQGINPKTKKPIKIAAKKVAKFKAGAELSAAVN
jgi:DNA-binding protein HU-beta